MSIEALKLLCSATKLDRDRGMQDVQKYLTTASANEIKCLETDVLRILEDAKSKPESKLGGLLAIKAILCHLRPVQYQGKDILSEKVARLCLELLSDPEVRVRIEAGMARWKSSWAPNLNVSRKAISKYFKHVHEYE